MAIYQSFHFKRLQMAATEDSLDNISVGYKYKNITRKTVQHKEK